MSILKISAHQFLLLQSQASNELASSIAVTSVVSAHFFFRKVKISSLNLYQYPRFCTINGDINACSLSDTHNCSPDHEGSTEKNEKGQGESLTTKEMLKRYGISGILSYGLLNTAYYLTTFLLVWFYVAPAPGRMGYFASVKRFLKIMAMVWAGSQVTKLVRAGCALALAPFVDRGLSWFTIKFKFESQGKAFFAIVGLCFGLAFVVFVVVTLLCA